MGLARDPLDRRVVEAPMSIATDAALDRILRARDQHETIQPLSEEAQDLSLAQGYSIQRALEGRLLARGERVIGWKVGFTTPVLQDAYGISHPVLGFMLGSGVFGSRDAVPFARFAALGVEAEVAFVMKADLAGPGVTPASALRAVEGALPSLELIDLRFAGKPRAADVVADAVFANAIVLGAPLSPLAGLDLALEGVVFEHNGHIAATSTAAEVMGNPLNALAWLANELASLGRHLRAGDLVLSGSTSKVLRPRAGDSVRASFTRLGSVSCRFA